MSSSTWVFQQHRKPKQQFHLAVSRAVALEISGKVTGIGFVSGSVLNATVIPLKVAGGGDAVSLDPSLTDIKYYSNTVRYDNIYKS